MQAEHVSQHRGRKVGGQGDKRPVAGRPSVDAVGAQLELEAGPARRPPWGEAGEQPALSCLGVGVGEAGPSRWRVSESLQQVDEPQWQQQRVPAGGEEAAGAAKLELVDGEVADSGQGQPEQQHERRGGSGIQRHGLVGEAAPQQRPALGVVEDLLGVLPGQ